MNFTLNIKHHRLVKPFLSFFALLIYLFLSSSLFSVPSNAFRLKINTLRISQDTIPDSNATNTPIRSTRTYRVKPGDTKFSLARAFDVSIKALESENPHIAKVLKAGDVITISNAKDPETMYIIQKGDTKFSLAKNNGINISLLESENPNIKNGLIIGHVIHIPKTDVSYKKTYVTESVDLNAPTKPEIEYIDYTLTKDYTLYSLSQMAGLKPSEFLLLNPHISNNVKIGTTVKMPKSADLTNTEPEVQIAEIVPMADPTATVITQDTEEIEENAEDESQQRSEEVSPAPIVEPEKEKEEPVVKSTVRVNPTNELVISKSYKDLSLSLDKTKQNSIVFLAPDELRGLILDLKDQLTSSSENPKILRYLDFYKGAQMAIDSISKMGVNTDFKITLLEGLMEKSQNIDALIVPFYEGTSEELLTNISKKDVPVIITSAMENTSDLNAIHTSPDINANKQRLVDHFKKVNAHVVIINDPRHRSDVKLVEDQINDLKTVTTDDVGRFNSGELISALKKGSLNMVIIDSSDPNIYLGVTNLLLTKLNDYNIQLAVMDAALIPGETVVSTKRYKILKLIYPSTYPAIATDKESKFISRFRKEYGQVPSENAIYGFDIVYDLLLRLSQTTDLITTFKASTTKQFNLKFQYEPSESGFKNRGVYLFQYDPNEGIKELD